MDCHDPSLSILKYLALVFRRKFVVRNPARILGEVVIAKQERHPREFLKADVATDIAGRHLWMSVHLSGIG